MSFGFGINDFIQVSHLAFKLFRKCRDSPKDFANLSSEVANLQVIVDDVRLTIREQQLDEAKTQEILSLGQGCLDCLLELEALLRRYHSLGTKSKRTFDRIGFEKDKVGEIRQRVISNAALLNAFQNSLTRSSVARLEAALNRFIDEYRHGQHEGSVISKATVESVQQEDEDIWQEIVEELEEEGITSDQIAENKQLIKERIVAALSGNLDRASLVSGSYRTATEGGGSSLLTGTTLFGENLPENLDWPGPLFRWMKELVQAMLDLYRDAPEQISSIRNRASDLWDAIVDVNYEVSDPSTLMYHENLSRKKRMEPIINQINQILRQLTRMEGIFKVSTPESELGYIWTCRERDILEADRLSEDLANKTDSLQVIFRDFGTIVLCNIEDRIKLIVGEVKARERSKSVLSSWEEMESNLTGNMDVTAGDVSRHQEAIQSFMRILTDDQELKDMEAQARNETGSIGESSRSRIGFGSFTSPPPLSESLPNRLGFAKSRSSLSGSEALEISSAIEVARMKPKRTSVLFIDLNNTERGPIAQAYLESLMAQHPTLASCFSRVLSAGLSASKPGVPLPPGVEFLLRDYGICEDFQHTSRRLEKRDVERFEYILAMNQAQIDEVLARYPTEISGKVALLGSFGEVGRQGAREVSHPESIHGSRFFHIGSKRIYPGYDKCLQEIKTYIADFVLELTGFDVHSPGRDGGEGTDSRDTSREISEDEDYSSVFQGQTEWFFDDEQPGFDDLSRAVSHFEETTAAMSPNNTNDQFPPTESPISVRIKPEPQAADSDEELLHKHHERFHRLVSLLSTDIGDSSFSSLRQNVLDWGADNTRNLLSVSTGGVQWVLEKISSETSDACSLCAAAGTWCGFVRDSQLNPITTDKADLLGKYLAIAIQQYRRQNSITEDNAKTLEQIRDNPASHQRAPPSLRDDVSVSVRNDKPSLSHDVAMIRTADAINGQLHKSKTFVALKSPKSRQKTLVRRTTQTSDIADLPPAAIEGPHGFRFSEPINATLNSKTGTAVITSKNATVKDKKAPKPSTSPARGKVLTGSVAPVSILFLSTAQIHGAIMAQVYLDSLITKSLALANKACDNVSAGICPRAATDRFNPKKLERLFKNHDILSCWPKKPQRVLLPEDVMDFNFILLLNGATEQSPFDVWIDENPDEARDMQEQAQREGRDWKRNFKTKIWELGVYLNPSTTSGAADVTSGCTDGVVRVPLPLMDPVQPSEESAFGVRLAKFEKHFQDIKKAVNGFLLAELSFDVESMEFVRKEGVTAIG
ncbi:MAG: hypothetical protein Q9227_000836 [Pyrenula ochraceoflavens]